MRRTTLSAGGCGPVPRVSYKRGRLVALRQTPILANDPPTVSMTKNKVCRCYSAPVRSNQYQVGNLPSLPGIFPDHPAPIVRNAAGEREIVAGLWTNWTCTAQVYGFQTRQPNAEVSGRRAKCCERRSAHYNSGTSLMVSATMAFFLIFGQGAFGRAAFVGAT